MDQHDRPVFPKNPDSKPSNETDEETMEMQGRKHRASAAIRDVKAWLLGNLGDGNVKLT